MTTLARSRDLILVERLQIEKAFENLALEQTGIVKEESAVKVGEWLGADVIVLGNFAQFGGIFRLDARLIEVKTGKLLVAQSVKGEQTKVIDKIDELGIEILKSFIGKDGASGGSGQTRSPVSADLCRPDQETGILPDLPAFCGRGVYRHESCSEAGEPMADALLTAIDRRRARGENPTWFSGRGKRQLGR